MSDIQIYHNPRCSKSRQTLSLLNENGVEPEIILYLETPPSTNQLKMLISQLSITARDLLRKSEDAYKTLNLKNPELSTDELLQAMHDNPKLIERPIVVKGDQAVLGRPPENVLNLL